MKTSVINIKTDPALKKKAQKVSKEMGVPLGTILNAYLRELVERREVTFRVPLKPNAKTAKHLRELDKESLEERSVGPFSPEEAADFVRNL